MTEHDKYNDKHILSNYDTIKDFEKFYHLYDKLEAAGQSNENYKELLELVKKFQIQGSKVREAERNKENTKIISREVEKYFVLMYQIESICNRISEKYNIK